MLSALAIVSCQIKEIELAIFWMALKEKNRKLNTFVEQLN